VLSDRRAPHRRLLATQDDDPLSGVANLFDVAMVFAVAILLVLLARAPRLGEAFSTAIPDGERLKRYRVSEIDRRGRGERLGVAYRLENGEVVYVPGAGD